MQPKNFHKLSSVMAWNKRVSSQKLKQVVLFTLFTLFITLCLPVFYEVKAQPPANVDDDIANFKEKQDQMNRLIEKHKPRLQLLNEQIDITTRNLAKISDFLAYPKNVKAFRDTSIKQLVVIRKQNDNHQRELEKIYFDWFGHSRSMAAVYTRFGELKITDRVDPELKKFLAAHRDLIFSIEKITVKIQDIYNETDFLLNTKLE